MMNLQPGQGLTQEEFKRLPTKQRHAYTEEKMGDRIMLTYNQAVRECRNAIASDEKLTQAFQIFQNEKDRRVIDRDPSLYGIEILMGAYVDKFKEKIFLVTHKGIHQYYHYVYDVHSKDLLLYSFDGPINDLPSDLSDMEVDYSPYIVKTFKEIWQMTMLRHIFDIPNVIRNNGNEYNLKIENQEYKNDNFYSRVQKNFNPLEKIEEINECFPSGRINSYFNPAHSTIDPEDLMNCQKFYSTKRAYNK